MLLVLGLSVDVVSAGQWGEGRVREAAQREVWVLIQSGGGLQDGGVVLGLGGYRLLPFGY